MSEAKLAHLACTFVLPAVAAVALYHIQTFATLPGAFTAPSCALAGTDDELS
ncbi:hypothetical protein ACLKMY_18125 [Paraburkholderia mimosarum]|uniref:hypothetical protein n=1 Tax=Paraburkholderia mimosarum TaxID=312026 RepID=UPI0039C0BDF2